MKIETDLHVHTVASGHAFSTVLEITRFAAARKMKAVGISDHGPALPGAPHLHYFRAMSFLPRHMEGVRLLRGVEANIINEKGELDVPAEILATLDYVLIGYHDGCGLTPKSSVKNTEIMIKAMRNPGVKVVTHPGNPAFPMDVSAFVDAAIDFGIAIEINNSSFKKHRSGSKEYCSLIASATARKGGGVCLSSDAHVATLVGMVDSAWEVASEAGVVEEQVVNLTFGSLTAFLNLKDD